MDIKKVYKVLCATMLAMLLLPLSVKAVPAYPKAVAVTQPNGSVITIKVMGDEFIRWAETTDGYTLLTNNEGYYVYATKDLTGKLIPTNVVATDEKLRTYQQIAQLSATPKHLRFSESQCADARALRVSRPNKVAISLNKSTNSQPQKAVTGNNKILVLLVSFKDITFGHSKQAIVNQYNQVGYSDNGETGSVRDYYFEESYGKLTLTADVVGPIRVSQNRAYYGAQSGSSNDVRPDEMVEEALEIAKDSVNFADYDWDGDGYVDGVHVIFAGHGEEAGGGANAIWSHSWAAGPVYDGSTAAYLYSCSPENRGSSGSNLSHIGVICHELGHVFGCQDYYDIDYSENGQYQGTGDWDIMGSGSWNNSGATPAHHNPLVKLGVYQWATETVLDQPCTVTLQPQETDENSFYLIETANPNEVYLIENRQQRGFNAEIPGHGLLIYRYNQSVSSYGINASHPQGFYPVSANASSSQPTSSSTSYGTINSSSCPFPGTNRKTKFTDTSVPSAKCLYGSYKGTVNNKPITNITETNGVITFDFMGGQGSNPFDFVATGVNSTTIDLSWRLFNNYEVMLVANTVNVFGTPANTSYTVGQNIAGGGEVIYVGNATSFSHINLLPGSTYYYRIYSKIPKGPIFEYSKGMSASASTGCSGLVSSFPIYLDFETELENSCWTVTAGSNSTWARATADDDCHGITPLGGDYFLFVRYKSTSGDVSFLNSPVLDFSSCINPKISLSYISEKWASDQDTLEIQAKVGNDWQTLKTFSNSVTAWAYDSVNIPPTATQVRLRGKVNYGYGIAVDNVMISGNMVLPEEECPYPTNLHDSIMSNGTVELTWQGSASSYSLTYTNLSTGVPTTVTVNGNSYVLNNISSKSVYSWSVQALCDGGKLSDVVPGNDFTQLPLGLDNLSDIELIVCPNPARDYVDIAAPQGEGDAQCTIIDVYGRVITSFVIEANGHAVVNVSNYPAGTYVVKCVSGVGSVTKQLIVY